MPKAETRQARQGGQRSFIEQARREQIVTAAIEVLYESGFAAASLGAIAERIGVSKGVLSYHFAGKSELLREVLVHVLTQAHEYMIPRLQAAGSFADGLRAYVTSNLEYIGDHRHEIIALREIINGMPPGGSEPPPYGEGQLRAVADVQQLLEGGQGAGEFGEFSAFVVAVSVRASIDALSGLLRADPTIDTAEYGTQLLGLYERAVRP
jgi:TetR/AcrR family fatty acid metabolism transcriptional regulator